MPNPEKKFSCGGINASIFENEILQSGKKIKIKKISFQKRFKDKDGSWKTTSILNRGPPQKHSGVIKDVRVSGHGRGTFIPLGKGTPGQHRIGKLKVPPCLHQVRIY